MSDRKTGQTYWRSLEQFAGSADVQKHIEQEFPGYDPKHISSMPRRRFMQIMGASMALAGLTATGCRRWPEELIVPSTVGTRGAAPGEFTYYATSLERGGVGEALMVTQSDGRPIKIEGNGRHPLFNTHGNQTYGVHRKKNDKGEYEGMILGGSDAFAQATLLDMYDPSRAAQGVLLRSEAGGNATASNWDSFIAAFRQAAGQSGQGVAVLAEAHSGVTYAQLKANFLKRFPNATWAEYEPLSRDNESAGSTLAFGKPVRAILNLKDAKTIVSLDADLLGLHPTKIRNANDWAMGRKSADGATREMNRLFIAETMLSQTGAVADQRLPIKPSRLNSVAMGLAAKLGVVGVAAPSDLTPAESKWIDAAAADIKSRGPAVVTAGLQTSPEVQALAHAINVKIGAVGKTVRYVELPADIAGRSANLDAFKNKLLTGGVTALLILGGNPVFDAPTDLGIADRIKSVPLSAHLTDQYNNETSLQVKYLLPRSHYLECWGDNRAFDGTVLIQQPLIEPLFDSRSTTELLALLVGDELIEGKSRIEAGPAIVRRALGVADDKAWYNALFTGFVAGTGYADASALTAKPVSINATAGASEYELRFQPSQQVYDGRFANNGWLLELPDSITKLTWDNAALVNKLDADKLGVKHGDIITITRGQAKVNIAVYVLWGQPKGVIGLPVGYGRKVAGPVGKDLGFDVYPLRTSSELYYAFGNNTVAKEGSTYKLISTSDYQQLLDDEPNRLGLKAQIERLGKPGHNGRIVREGSLDDYKKNPRFAFAGIERLPLNQLWDGPVGSKGDKRHDDAPQFFNTPHAWGMSIDMTTCIGCNACTIACQAENNIPVVGKDMVEMNREMTWIRIDRYFKPALGPNRETLDFENVDVVFMPMACVHCENAPCEQVCPVAATVHDTEGLNTMVYNRCIGTRYCSNNCPYKVRRFNYFDFQSRNPRGSFLNSMWIGIPDEQQKASIAEVKRLVFNPEVTVRMRGVMEKCTYCTQRIKAATIVRKNEFVRGERSEYVVDDFDVVTACQQACPTQAIVFGDLQNKDSAVSKMHKLGRGYFVLEDLNTRPRTKYLAKLRNPAYVVVNSAETATAES
ncbi:MAG: TAT-variant-translocated molybdopterin oxidoreductase [Tepidisphaeraceae bacterium]